MDSLTHYFVQPLLDSETPFQVLGIGQSFKRDKNSCSHRDWTLLGV